MQAFSVRANREVEAWAAVAAVNDPELDEPVTDMGFVERIEVAEDGAVELDFRLPTYWCSPNFAFLMLDGVRMALERLPWRPRARIVLHDHLFADEVNSGLAAGKRFDQIFEALSPGEDLEALREKFARKAFERRQEAVLSALRSAGWSVADILALRRGDLAAPLAGLEQEFRRYADALKSREPGAECGSPAFVDGDGVAIEEARFDVYLARLRAVRINMEFNGALCRGLKQVRYHEKSADDKLMLVDFLTEPVATCHAGA